MGQDQLGGEPAPGGRCRLPAAPRLRAEEIIWPEKNRRARPLAPDPRASSSSGCRAAASPGWPGRSPGELDQEVRLLGPSDLRGAFIGWGQAMIREQFDWVAESERRMLIIDELDAVAHSRRDPAGHAHGREGQRQRAAGPARPGFAAGSDRGGTTNFIGTLDEAVVRSGRFGRFIPSPARLRGGCAILGYYLGRLRQAGLTMQRTIEVPYGSALGTLLGVAPGRERPARPILFAVPTLKRRSTGAVPVLPARPLGLEPRIGAALDDPVERGGAGTIAPRGPPIDHRRRDGLFRQGRGARLRRVDRERYHREAQILIGPLIDSASDESTGRLPDLYRRTSRDTAILRFSLHRYVDNYKYN